MTAAHTPPMPMPNSARIAKSIPYDVEKPPRNEKTEYQRIENISGPLRPQRSAAVPAPMPPATRKISVMVPSAPASALSTVKLRWMSTSRNVRMVKSKPSSTQPRKQPANAFHCAAVTSLYQAPDGLAVGASSDTWAIARDDTSDAQEETPAVQLDEDDAPQDDVGDRVRHRRRFGAERRPHPRDERRAIDDELQRALARVHARQQAVEADRQEVRRERVASEG